MATDAVEYLNFDRVAGCYDATRYVPPAVLHQAARIIVEDAGLNEDSVLLDAGVGTGRFARYVRESGSRVVGVDISADMLSKAATLPNVRYLVRADLRALPFRDAVFDAALVVHVLHLVSDWKRVIRELRRVLGPGVPLYLGSETGKHFVSRSIYFQVAAEWKLTRPNLGAESLDVVLDHVAATGAELTRLDREQLCWTARTRVGEMLDALKDNPFSHLWHIEPEVHMLLVAESERRAREVFPSLDHVERAPASLMLWRAEWP